MTLGSRPADHVGGFGRIAGCVLEPGDVRDLEQVDQEVAADLASGSDRNVVQDDRKVGRLGHGGEVMPEPLLGRAVVVRGDVEQTVHAQLARRAR